jgi:hypothetical protein
MAYYDEQIKLCKDRLAELRIERHRELTKQYHYLHYEPNKKRYYYLKKKVSKNIKLTDLENEELANLKIQLEK